ncbi:chemotaxis protein CheW [Planktothrix sp. FACHB-1355]|uniref:Chemotaxis protein CheW n=1 Tax=Aerosakkonema funiforme FACHB-1375 TaxID=2949571 RepID=A0A926ZMC7_9CYAN|nr:MULTISPECIES: chemotaxis protein CheW [Oscillatoriales]MBD2185961.1 chemotaxis protein CheW [Aerosakkonema funiforme FACHB-1375]MBD3561099.1 chemotaxis protein CheW [Planktothrix sp. FACHB-1355]
MNRRFRSKRNLPTRIPTHKLLCFQLGNERYAIPIDRVLHVLNEFTPHGVIESDMPNSTLRDRSLVKYKDEIITLIYPSQLFLSSRDDRERQYLIVCTLKEGERFAIPVPEIPTVLQVAEDNFGEVPELYDRGNLPPAIEKVIQSSDNNIVFYLNLDKLVNPNP